MRFSKRTRPKTVGPAALIALTAITGVGILAIVFGCGMIARAAAVTSAQATFVVAIPTQAETAQPQGTPSATPTAWSVGELLFVPSVTVTPVVNDPRPPTHTPTPAIQPTNYYSAPANPTPIPTPVLPPAAPFPTSCDGPGRMNILVMGMDGRSDNYDRAARTDVLMLIGVNFSDKTAQILSIPRDLWVQIPEVGNNPLHENRINTAYELGVLAGYPGGGSAFQAYTISQNFGIRVDRTVVLNFNTFENAIDAVGGVDISVSRPIHDDKYPDDSGGSLVLDIPAGDVHMDGRTALMYARTRHQDSDFGRMRRQQQVVMALRDKLLSPDTLTALPSLAQLLYNSVKTDISWDEVGLLGCVGPRIDASSITRIVIDSSMVESFKTEAGAQVLRPKMDMIQSALEAFSTGQ